MVSGARALAPRLASQFLAKLGHGDAGDGAPVEVPVDQLLDVREAQVGALAAYLYQQFLDAGVVALMGGTGPARCAHLSQQILYHVAHPPIFGDPEARLQVTPGVMLPRTAQNRGTLAC
jgi:hypothetical protein